MKPLKGSTFQIRKENDVKPRASIAPISIRRVNTSSNQQNISTFSTKENIYYSLSDIHPSLEQEEDLPNKVTASYINDFNLFRIHDLIIRKLRAERRQISRLEDKIKTQVEAIKKPQTVIERKRSKEKIKEIKESIREIESGRRIKKYLELAEPLIHKYESLVPKSRQVDFTATDQEKMEQLEEEEKNPNYWKKMQIVQQYIDLAQKYITVTVIQKKKNMKKCPCGYDLTNVFIDNFGTQICPECGNDRYIIGYNSYKRDNLSSRNDYSDRDNFEKALMRYQGKQVDKIPETLFGDLDEYFKMRGKSVSAVIKSLPYTSRGRKPGTDLPMLYKALLETGYSSLYEDAILIAHKYWGWKLSDVSHLEAVIMRDYQKTQRVYNMLPKERSSSLGTQFRLFKHLELRGHVCSVGDFKIVKMRDSLEFHDETWRQMCEGCEDPSIYFIPTI